MSPTASIVVERRVEWVDTDAGGHFHFLVVPRWAESAETLLLERLGLRALTQVTPRVSFHADFHAGADAGDVVAVELAVASVGRSSIRYDFQVRRDDTSIASGWLVAVNCPVDGRPAPVDDEVRRLLLHAGPQPGERLAAGQAGSTSDAPEAP